MKMLVVLGEGGHTTELLNLVDLMGTEYEYHYVMSRQDNLSTDRIRLPGKIYRIVRPRGKDTPKLAAVFKTLLAALEAMWVLMRVRPVAILSTGPAIAVPVFLLGRLCGARSIFVETGSRVRELSWTGRIMYGRADLFFVQWPQLQTKFPDSIYAGRLI